MRGAPRLGELERAGVAASLFTANAESIAPEPKEQGGSGKQDARDRGGADELDWNTDREQQEDQNRERETNRQRRKAAGSQLEPHLCPRRGRARARKPEQVDHPLRVSACSRLTGHSCDGIAAALPC